MSVLRAFVERDFRVAWSYRFSFVTQFGAFLFTLVSMKFLSELFADGSVSALEAYGGDYFSFVVIGLAINLVALPAVGTFAASVRGAQVTGTFEAMLATRTSPLWIVTSSAGYAMLLVLTQLLVLLAIAVVALDAGLDFSNLGLAALLLAFTLAAFAGVGLLSCAFTVAFNQREPLTGAFLAASLLLSGVLYPTAVLPGWLELLSPLLPMTHALELARGLFLEGADVDHVGLHFAALAAFSLLLPLGLWTLSRSLTWARATGSLAHY